MSRCQGFTKTGEECKNKISSGKYCHLHDSSKKTKSKSTKRSKSTKISPGSSERTSSRKKENLYVAKSKIPGAANGLFTAKGYKKGETIPKSGFFLTSMNDADFQYPSSFTGKAIRTALTKYLKSENKSSASVCNTKISDDSGDLVALKKIEPGDELTRHYTLFIWAKLLFLDAERDIFELTTSERNKRLEEFKKVLADFEIDFNCKMALHANVELETKKDWWGTDFDVKEGHPWRRSSHARR